MLPMMRVERELTHHREMHMRRSMSIGFAGLVLSAIAAPLSAQAVAGSFVHFGITGGATVPVSDLNDIAKTGWNAGGIGGAGVYNIRARDSFDSDNSHSTTKLGMNGGVGARFRLNGFITFVEARYHCIVNGGEFGSPCNGSINVSRISAVIEPGTCGLSPSLQLIPLSVGSMF